MNLQRIAAIVAISGAVLGGASVVALGAAAYAAGQSTPVTSAEPTHHGAVGVDSAPTEQPPAPEVATPPAVAEASDERLPGTGPMAADYNPYLEPGDPEYVSPEERAEYLGQDAVVRQCMNDAGFEYLPNLWWIDEGPQPSGLDFETSVLWTQALYGPDIYNPGGGCADVGVAAAEAARAAGTPLTAPVPPDDPSKPTPRERSLEYEEAVRECMAEAGFDVRYFEWWNPEHQPSDPRVDPRMPADLGDEAQAAWGAAMGGDAGGGAAYRWQDAGCSGYATHVTGNDNMH
ncbi:hypothetical protein LQ757_02300 [Agromyces sp. SYSU K20354]|uniref:hypothetical protein n=1 Tax=Agromyces cavernae TaxID=2898659 RepID=UPI001E566BC3|nr:hypothetical protein [Agromyces cavernae]MCD2441098.1 hypothetical protein [Agromyces cavernae]